MNINNTINALLNYAIDNKLIEEIDSIYSANKLISILEISEFERENKIKLDSIDEVLNEMLQYAISKQLVEDNIVAKDLFDTKIMDCVMPRPSEIINSFNQLYAQAPIMATNYYYSLSKASNYIRMSRINKNIKWKTNTPYGVLDITINMSKPEKDPKIIAMQGAVPQGTYPKCLLCYENVGYQGNLNQPARQNHRVIPLDLCGEDWYLQYSPYVYYNEHCIVFKKEHEPMKISQKTFEELLGFVEMLPHYFIGSNADIPIVGGSILSHNHYQGGNNEFAMAKAKSLYDFKISGYDSIHASYLDWPLDVIRLSSAAKQDLIALATKILYKWVSYSNEAIGLLANSDGCLHNAITPIARKRNEAFELDLVLRNNRTDIQYPDGIFHPSKELHHIKKENIGLIEVLGLAILPARLKTELSGIRSVLLKQQPIALLDTDSLSKHKPWCMEILSKYNQINEKNIDEILKYEIGQVFMKVLECCSVFRMGDKVEEVKRFIQEI